MLVPGITQAKGSTILYPREICLGWFSQSRPQMFCFPFLLLPEFGAGKSSGSGRLSTGSTLGNFRRILESCWRVLEFWWRDLCWWILPFLVPEKNPVILGFCFRKQQLVQRIHRKITVQLARSQDWLVRFHSWRNGLLNPVNTWNLHASLIGLSWYLKPPR